MKKVIWSLVFLFVFSGGYAAASSQWGQYKGNEIVRIVVNGKTINPEVPGQIVDGSTLVPLRSISEALGANVQWDGATYTANIQMATTPQVSPTPLNNKLTAKDIAKLTDRVGTIIAYDQSGRPFSQGSGFVINQGGFLITNSHVMKNYSSWDININGKTYHSNLFWFDNPTSDLFATYIDNDPQTRLASKDANFPFLIYDTKLPEVGEKVFAIGSPQGLSNSVSEGIVSGIRTINGMTYIQHTAPIDHGSSGGALLNESGQVIGVTNAGYEGTSLEFAIPMSYVQQEIDKLAAKK